MSSSQQKRSIKEFKTISGVSDKIAKDVLSSNGYNLEMALDDFFNNRHKYPATKKGSKSKLEKIFAKYADQDDPTHMDQDGVESFFSDIGADPEGVEGLAIPWKLSFPELGMFPKQQFVAGFAAEGVDTLQSIKDQVRRFRMTLSTNFNEFRKFYKWLFEFVKGDEKKKTVPKELAFAIFGIVFDDKKWPLKAKFQGWADQAKESDCVFTKDLWEQLLEFMHETKADLSDFDDCGAWPVAIDEFVGWQRAQ